MNLHDIINSVADEADELLGGCSSPEEARVELQDHMKAHYPKLSAAESKAAITGVLAILTKEGFFEGAPGNDGFGADDADDGFEEEP
jgi:hypothetical protein